MDISFWYRYNILFLKDISKTNYSSLFEQPYLAFWKKMYEKYDTKVQFNIHGKSDNFYIGEITDKYKEQWQKNAHWIRFSFHQMDEPFSDFSYNDADYNKMKMDYLEITSQIERFAGKELISPYIVIHHGAGDKKALSALRDCGVKGLGAGTWVFPDGTLARSYYLTEKQVKKLIKEGMIYDEETELYFFPFDLVLNKRSYSIPDLIKKMKSIINEKAHWSHIEITFEEWAFTPFSRGFFPDAMKRVETVLQFLKDKKIKPIFIEEIL